MLRFLLRRLLALPPLLLAVSLLTFVLLESSQGDYFTHLLQDPQVSQEHVAQLREQLGLQRPLPQRYGRWLMGTLRGDLGHSFRYHAPVAGLIAERLGNTLLLAVSGLLLVWGAALPLGLLAAQRPGGLLDRGVGLLATLGLAMPRVLLALLALALAASTGLFPVGGLHDPVAWDAWGPAARSVDVLWHLALPASVLALGGLAGHLRHVKAALQGVLDGPCVRAARAKGLPERRVLLRHALPNAANPLVTLLGQDLGRLLAGSFLVEVVFAWPGLARLSVEALLGKDVYLVMACVLVASVALVLGNLAADVLLAALDPRVREAAG